MTYVAPTLPILIHHTYLFFFSSWLTPPILFSYSLIINWTSSSYLYSWSRPIPPVLYLKLLLTIRISPPEFYPQLRIYISHMFFFSDCVFLILRYFRNPNVIFFYFVDAGQCLRENSKSTPAKRGNILWKRSKNENRKPAPWCCNPSTY